jgi:hypothetical protein
MAQNLQAHHLLQKNIIAVVGKNKIKRKLFIRDACLGILLMPLTASKFVLSSGFLHCNRLEEFVSARPKNFIVEEWKSDDNINWQRVSEITYLDVIWEEHVFHSDSIEMSACRASINFTCSKQTFNFKKQKIITEDRILLLDEFIDLTANCVNGEK